MPATDTVFSALRDRAANQGAARALRFFDVAEMDHDDAVPQVLTHQQLFQRATALANAFRALAGVDAPVVSLLIPSTIEGTVALLAAEIAGKAHPINHYLDPDSIRDAMLAAGTDIAVALGPHPTLPVWDKLQRAAAGVPGIRATVVTDRLKGLDGAHSVRELVATHPSDRLTGPEPQPGTLAALFNTAGTTGVSKIVPLTHANLLASARGLAAAWQFSADTRIVNALPFFHVAGANLLLLAPLIAGGEVLLLSESGLRNPQVLSRHWDIVQATRPTIIGGIPSSLVALMDVPLNGADIRSVRFCATGGAPMPSVAAREFQRRFGLPVHTIYGMTEAAGLIATAPAGMDPDYDTVGRAVPGTELHIRRLGADGPGDIAGMEEAGVICVRGPQIFGGYLGTDGGLLPDGWLATGDMGRIGQGGALSISGRSKDLIIRSGNNIDPAVIEHLANDFAGVAESAAVAMPDRYAGEVPALFVVPRDGGISSPALMRHLREKIPDPHAQPARILVLDQMPLTAVGKASRIELRRRAAEIAVQDALADICDGIAVAVRSGPDGTLTVQFLDSDTPASARHAIAALGLAESGPVQAPVQGPAQGPAVAR